MLVHHRPVPPENGKKDATKLKASRIFANILTLSSDTHFLESKPNHARFYP